MPRVITVASQKGGVGKTTTTVNLAASLCLAGKTALLMDLCPQGNATSGVGASTGGPGYFGALTAGESLEAFWQATSVEGLKVLPANDEVADLGRVSAVIGADPAALRASLQNSAEDFDFVLIDCPPSLTGPPTIALHLSDSVLIPVQCEYYAMEGLSQILPLIQEMREATNLDLKIEGLLLTMFSPELDLSAEVVDEVSRYFEGQAFRTIVPRDVTLAEAASHGVPAVEYAPLARGTWSYVELAKEVLAHGEA